MPEVPKAVVEIEDFGGLALAVDEFNLQQGQTHVQTNFVSEREGSMLTRVGYVQVQFDNE